MTPYVWFIVAAAVVAGSAFPMISLWRIRQKRQLEAARRLFHQRREWLEAKFLELASSTGKPRGLRWKDCDFSNEVTFARDLHSRALTAFVGVTISFEAIEGGDMEDVEAVGNLRAATSVFRHAGGQWSTQGRVLMNLEPAEAIERFQDALELIAD
ncbi:MAG TPA: hypothetical protein VMX74_04330 [Pirellulales bacterium]|nr:hypothetical protein [Pirellulales bacterium]